MSRLRFGKIFHGGMPFVLLALSISPSFADAPRPRSVRAAQRAEAARIRKLEAEAWGRPARRAPKPAKAEAPTVTFRPMISVGTPFRSPVAEAELVSPNDSRDVRGIQDVQSARKREQNAIAEAKANKEVSGKERTTPIQEVFLDRKILDVVYLIGHDSLTPTERNPNTGEFVMSYSQWSSPLPP